MTYIPPEETPRQPPPHTWKSEQERKEWFARNRPPAPPAPDLPTRDSSRKQYPSEPNRLWQAILSFIDWLNRLVGAEKPKVKNSAEQMLTLGELFEGYEDIPEDMVTFREDRERGAVHYKPPPPPLPPYPPTRDITRM